MALHKHTAPASASLRVQATAKACRRWAWLPLILAAAAVVAAPEFGGDAYTWQVRYLSYVVAAIMALAAVVLFAVCAVLRSVADALNRDG